MKALLQLLRPYRLWLIGLLLLTLGSNGLSLLLPRLIAKAIDAASLSPGNNLTPLLQLFIALAIGILLLGLVQSQLQALTAERVARDLRQQIAVRLSYQPMQVLQDLGADTLLTRLTSDVEAIKLFVSQVLVAMISSLLLIVGASALLLNLNWRLALLVLLTLPLMAFAFRLIFGRARQLFGASQAVVDRLNRVINESILGAALVRILNTAALEQAKFDAPNTEARQIGLKILGMFASLIPVINLVAGLGSLLILVGGGYLVIQDQMTLGELAAFEAYLLLLIFPILVLGFTSQQMARAAAAYTRLQPLLDLPAVPPVAPAFAAPVRSLQVQDLSLTLNERPVLKALSFELAPGSKTAVLGPTAAGKSQLLQVLAGLRQADSGRLSFDGQPLKAEHAGAALPPGLAMVFQDSILFQLSLRENIAFGRPLSDAELAKVLQVAELTAFVAGLPQGLDTPVSERGLNLSGGQKQRLMLARALASQPSLLLLDDFTARVDPATEARILDQLSTVYPELTVLLVTQKVATAARFDQVLLLMEGELLASGSPAQLLQTSPEYMQIAESQRSTEHTEPSAHAP